MALMGPPLAGSLPPSMLCSLVQALASRPLPPSCRASYTGGGQAVVHLYPGAESERCPPLPAPCYLSPSPRLTSFPLLFLLLLFFLGLIPPPPHGLIPPPATPPSLPVPCTVLWVLRNLILTPNSKSPPLRHQKRKHVCPNCQHSWMDSARD